MKMNLTLLTFLVVCAVVTSALDYYWRPFDGTIPDDAFVATTDRDYNTYIGMAGTYEGGERVGQLFPGIREINTTGCPSAADGSVVHKRNNNIHILCTRHPEMFEWIPTSASSFNSVPYHKVEGGYEGDNYAQLRIARMKYQNLYVIGKIVYNGFSYFFDGQQEMESNDYEILVYKEVVSSKNKIPGAE